MLTRHSTILIAASLAGLALVAVLLARDSGGPGEPVPEALDPSFDAGGLALTATDADAGGVDPNTRFVLTSESPLSWGQVAGALNLTPGPALRIERRSAHEYALNPIQPLTEDTVYRFDFTGQGGILLANWAFQVQAPLRIAGTSPAAERAGVPLDAGIEITFSQDGVVRPEDFVEISPPLQGHFEQHKRTLVFVPRELAPFTLYIVTVKPGVTVAGSDLVLRDAYEFQFETGSVVRGGPPAPPARFLSRLNSASTRDAPILSLASAPSGDLSVDVYAYGNLDAFLADLDRLEAIPSWAVHALDHPGIDLSSLTRIATMTLQAETSASPGGPAPPVAPPGPRTAPSLAPSPFVFAPSLRFPEALARGYYLVRIEGATPALAWLQVTDVAAYVALGRKDTLVWLNDVASGDALGGASVEGKDKHRLASTDKDGIAKFSTPDGAVSARDDRLGGGVSGRGYFVIRDAQGRAHVAPLSPVLYTKGRFYASEYAYASASGDYWAVLTTDRPIYKPSDTIRFWGVARPREGKQEIELRLVMSGYDSRGRVELAASKPVKTSPTGSFEGTIPFEGIAVGGYQLEVQRAGERIFSTYVQIDTYTKPAYRLGVTADRVAYINGEPVNLDVDASFFEGTPVAGLDLSVGSSSQRPEEKPHVVTDADGRASLSFQPEVSPGSFGGRGQESGFASAYIEISPAAPEEAEIGGSAMVAVFPADVGLRISSSYEGGVIRLAGAAYEIDTARIKDFGDLYLRPAGDPLDLPPYAGARAGGQEISLKVTQVRYQKTETGEAYDFISKTARKSYRYDRIEDLIDTRALKAGLDGRFSYDLPTEEGRTYQIEVSTKDAAGRLVWVNTTTYSRTIQPRFALGYLDLRFREDSGNFGAPRQFALGEDVKVGLSRSDGEQLPAGGANRYLFYEAQRGSLSATVQDSPDIDFRFDEDRIPNVVLRAVYFNGSSYVEAGPEGTGALSVQFNPQERRLNVEITPEKPGYGPGDDASVAVRVTDAAGKPVRADVSIAAVDEALFSVRDFSAYQLDILNRLYQPVPDGLVRTYTSHPLPLLNIPSAPRTGGGDSGTRSNFQDTAFFATVRTDGDGRASVKFKLPDNLTSWRLTGFGLSAEVRAGTGQAKIAVRRPFFIDASLNDDYLAGDIPSLRLRGFGADLKAGDIVRYEVSAPGLGLSAPITAQGPAFEGVDVALPPLTEGDYEITIRGVGGVYSDSIVRKISVVASRVALPQARFVEDVRSGADLQVPAAGRATVTFVDGGRGAYYDTLSRLAGGRGDRADQAVARVLAGRLLTRYFDDPPRPEDFDPKVYTQQGVAVQGVALLPFSGPDLVATARLAAAADLIGRNAMRPLLQQTADDPNETAERQAIALYGLAGLGDPVLGRLRSLRDEPALGWRGRLYVGLGLGAAGAASGAKSVFDALLRDFGEDVAPYARLKVGVDQDDIVEATALAAVLAAGVNDPRADALMRYARDNHQRDLLLVLEELDFAQKRLQRLPAASAAFALTIGGQQTDVALERGRARSFSLSPAELKALRIDVKDGRLGASIRFSSGVATSQLSQNADLTISRTLTPLEGAGFTRTGLVKVTIEFSIGAQAPDGCYEVDDVLPSGLKPVSTYGRAPLIRYLSDPSSPNSVRTETVIYPYRVEGQRVSFCLYKGSRSPVVYFARPTGAGVFRAEPAIFFNQDAPDVITSSRSQSLTIP